jgi:hypothetical protein
MKKMKLRSISVLQLGQNRSFGPAAVCHAAKTILDDMV